MINYDILSKLEHHIGSTSYSVMAPLFPNCVITEGIKDMAETCGAYWLVDLACSHTAKPRIKSSDGFIVWTIKRTEGNRATVYSTDGNDNVLTRQNVPFTDFFDGSDTIDRYSFWMVRDHSIRKWVLMLPSEY